jgi:hypothetical protein
MLSSGLFTCVCSLNAKFKLQTPVNNPVKSKGKGKVPHWGTSTPQPQGLLCSHPEGVPSFISRGAAHRTVCSASASEGRNYVKRIVLPI